MTRTVTALFETQEAAEQALGRVSTKVPLLDSAVVSQGIAGSFALDNLSLSPEERAACQAKMAGGGFLMIAQVPTDEASAAVVRLVEAAGSRGEIVAPPADAPAQPSEAVIAEEKIPLVEEELRTGPRELLRGGARVRSFTTEVPVQEQVELAEERTTVEQRPSNRRLTEEEIQAGGLLQERVVEITQMREEAVVSKAAFIREELVVKKSVHHRTEEIHETLMRTDVQTEEFGSDELSRP